MFPPVPTSYKISLLLICLKYWTSSWKSKKCFQENLYSEGSVYIPYLPNFFVVLFRCTGNWFKTQIQTRAQSPSVQTTPSSPPHPPPSAPPLHPLAGLLLLPSRRATGTTAPTRTSSLLSTLFLMSTVTAAFSNSLRLSHIKLWYLLVSFFLI